MTGEQRRLVDMARQSLAAARVLLKTGFPEYAAGRAYCGMFYLATGVTALADAEFRKFVVGAHLEPMERSSADAARQHLAEETAKLPPLDQEYRAARSARASLLARPDARPARPLSGRRPRIVCDARGAFLLKRFVRGTNT